jgi:hypothetical protein
MKRSDLLQVPRSRRGFMMAAAVTASVTAATTVLPGQSGGTAQPTEVQLLNAALALAQLEATMYAQYLGGARNVSTGNVLGSVSGNPAAYTQQQFRNSPFVSGTISNVNDNLFLALTQMRDQSLRQAELLRAEVVRRNGTPVTPCAYTASNITSIDSFLQTAQALSNASVAAWVSIIGQLQDQRTLQLAASILAVRARQAGFLNVLTGGTFSATGLPPNSGSTATTPGSGTAGSIGNTVPGVSPQAFPSAVEAPLAPSQIAGLLTSYLGACAAPLTAVNPTFATITPSNLTFNSNNANISATLNSSFGMPRNLQFQVAPGGLVPAILQTPNSSSAIIQFVNGPGVYYLQLVATDQNGQTYTQAITLTYNPGAGGGTGTGGTSTGGTGTGTGGTGTSTGGGA